MRHAGTVMRALGLLVVLSALSACRYAKDAEAVAHQMSVTADSLNMYYAALDQTLQETIALNELDGAISGIPFDAASRGLIEDTRAEIVKREEIAQSLAALAASFTTLTQSKAASDVQTAASALGNELVKVKALPGGSPVPDALGRAGKLLLEIAQVHEEKKAAIALDQTLTAVETLFEKEEPVYDSMARTHIFLAMEVAQDLITRKGVDPVAMLEPALKPFHLAPLPASPALQGTLGKLGIARLKASSQEATDDAMQASAAMLACLREMSTRMHTLATEKQMPARDTPLTLKTVKRWAESVLRATNAAPAPEMP